MLAIGKYFFFVLGLPLVGRAGQLLAGLARADEPGIAFVATAELICAGWAFAISGLCWSECRRR